VCEKSKDQTGLVIHAVSSDTELFLRSDKNIGSFVNRNTVILVILVALRDYLHPDVARVARELINLIGN